MGIIQMLSLGSQKLLMLLLTIGGLHQMVTKRAGMRVTMESGRAVRARCISDGMGQMMALDMLLPHMADKETTDLNTAFQESCTG